MRSKIALVSLQKKREAIKKYAQEHNFYPNILAESLRKSKVQPMKIIGVIVPQLDHFYFSSILSGIEEEASSRGYRLMVAQSKENYETKLRFVGLSQRVRYAASSFHKRRILLSMTISKHS